MGLKDLGKNTATTYLEAAAVVEDSRKVVQTLWLELLWKQ